MMRINKFLALCGIASRRKCDEILAQGRIKVNGSVCSNLGVKIDEKKDIVEVDDQRCSLPEKYIYLKLNKPKGYICSSSDDRGRKTVLDIVREKNISERLFSVGRLDYDTEGLLILTNDGDIANAVIHPSTEVEKEYYCTIEGDIKESQLAVLRNGVVINGYRMPKAKVFVLGKLTTKGGVISRTKLSITISEGQNHQIRKMISAINKNIILLKRVSIGEIKLGGLKRGEIKPLTNKELAILSKYYDISCGNK